MTYIPPVVLHGDDGPVLLHFYFAAMPPPPGPLEEADIEDEEDYYGDTGLSLSRLLRRAHDCPPFVAFQLQLTTPFRPPP